VTARPLLRWRVAGRELTITWPALPGKTYEVQFKNDLSDPSWTPLNASITIVGENGYATDFAPDAVKRFYRIKAY